MATPETSLTNPITADVWEGIRSRHSLVESADQPTEAARAMAYLSHLDRRDLIAEIERLQKELRRLAQEVVDEDKRTVGPEGPSAGLLDLAENALKGLSDEPPASPADWDRFDPALGTVKSGEHLYVPVSSRNDTCQVCGEVKLACSALRTNEQAS